MKNPVGILDCVREAFRNPLALLMAVPPAAFLPIAVFIVAHNEISSETTSWVKWTKVVLVIGGLTFSAKSVYGWALQMFEDHSKALGFVVLMEGVMVFAKSEVLGFCALALLVGINAVAAAAKVAAGDRRSTVRRRAAKKSARTRTKSRIRLAA